MSTWTPEWTPEWTPTWTPEWSPEEKEEDNVLQGMLDAGWTDETTQFFQPVVDYRTGEQTDAAAQNFYKLVKENPSIYDNLLPQEQMQYQFLRYVNGEISGNNKDDQIKKVRKAHDLPKEKFIGEKRYIVRNKPDKAGRKDGISPSDAFSIGMYTQPDTGKDDGMLSSFINKSLPGFDVGDILDVPGINFAAAAAAPFTYGISSAALEALKLAEGKDFGLDSVLAFAPAVTNAGGMLQGAEASAAGEIGKEVGTSIDPFSLGLAGLKEVDPWEPARPDYEPETDVTKHDEILERGPQAGQNYEEWLWDVYHTIPNPGSGGGGSEGSGGGTLGEDEVGQSERTPQGDEMEDEWTWNGAVLVNNRTGTTQEVPNPSRMEEGSVYNQDAEKVGDPEEEVTEYGELAGYLDWVFKSSLEEPLIDPTEPQMTPVPQPKDPGDGGGGGGGGGDGDGGGGGGGDGEDPGTPNDRTPSEITYTLESSGMLGEPGSVEWEDFMSGINVDFQVLQKMNITPSEYLNLVFERMR